MCDIVYFYEILAEAEIIAFLTHPQLYLYRKGKKQAKRE